MPSPEPMLTAREAARLLGVSYPAIKQWILGGKIKTTQTPGGHHRIAQSALKPFIAKDKTKSSTESRERFRRVSGRNQLAGKVVSIRIEGLLAEVVLSIGDNTVTAIITASAVRELRLKKGDTAAALIKSTDVMIERLDEPVREFPMSDFIPKPGTVKVGGLGRAAQKLQAAREKAANVKSGSKPDSKASVASFKAKDSFANTKKTTFQRKAV